MCADWEGNDQPLYTVLANRRQVKPGVRTLREFLVEKNEVDDGLNHIRSSANAVRCPPPMHSVTKPCRASPRRIGCSRHAFSTAPALRPFFAYPHNHLRNNGADGTPLFQPVAPGQPRLPAVDLYAHAGFTTVARVADMLRIDGVSHDLSYMTIHLSEP